MMDQRTVRAVFLDRDGVINRVIVKNKIPHPPVSLSELEILPGVHDALGTLRRHGFLLIVATNQPDVARGTQKRQVVEALHASLCSSLPLDDIFVCYHDDKDHCDCRKPKPGLLTRAAVQHNIDLAASFMIGDRWKDIEAGRRAGCKTILVNSTDAGKHLGTKPDYQVPALPQAVGFILDIFSCGERN